MKILVFLHGTTIMHKDAVGCSREERVQHVQNKNPSVKEYSSYVPVGNAVEKLRAWESQGAEILYLSSHEDIEDLNKDKEVLARHDFPKGEVFWRQDRQGYKDVAEQIMPDVLIEDDCESIGGEKEMTITFVDPEKKKKIKSIPVPEFGGIDHLPNDINELLKI